MNDSEKDKDKKSGFGAMPTITGTPSIVGGSAPGLSSAAGSFFAGKAGLVALVLGSATVAAGVGVVYNFIGPSSKPAYSPELFQNSYYEEEASRAGQERASSRDTAAAEPSTLDMFKEQAKKDGLGGLDGEAADGAAPNAAAEAPAGTPSADSAAPAAPAGDMPGAGASKLRAAAGFAAKGGGGGGSSMPRMQGGGLSGGIGGKFDAIYKAPAQANAGKTSGMTALAARVKSSPKSVVPSFNKKGAFGQAKYAGKLGVRAAGSSAEASHAYATEALGGGSAGSGEVATGGSGAGIGGAGVSDGSKLKGSDPSLNTNNSTPPKVPEPENVSPWQKMLDLAMKAMLIAAVLIMAAKWLATTYPVASQILAYAAMLAAAVVMYAAYKIMSEFGQKWTGMMYMVVGGALMVMAYKATAGAGEADTTEAATKAGTNSSWFSQIFQSLFGKASSLDKKDKDK